jgi:hypothetical protein
VQGCDASVLLAGNEQNDSPNLTLRGYDVIASIKAQVEAICKQTVSCADNTVRNFASNPSAFSSAFATAMIKMGNISPLTGTQGQIRTTCSAAN